MSIEDEYFNEQENIHGRCDHCGKFCSTNKGAHYYSGINIHRTEPDEPSELICKKCWKKE